MNKSATRHLKHWNFPQSEPNADSLLAMTVRAHYRVLLSVGLRLLVHDNNKEETASQDLGNAWRIYCAVFCEGNTVDWGQFKHL